MKILVTGGAGYIGSTVTGLLTEKGHKLFVYDNLSHGRRDLLPAGAQLIDGELGDRAHLERVFTGMVGSQAAGTHEPFDAVLHFAALIEAGESMQRPEIYFRNNTASTLSLLEAMLTCGVKRLVFSSTAAVYGEPESIPIQEDARLVPTNAYGQSKLLVEQMLTWLHRIHGLQYASLRYFNVAGAAEGPEGIVRGESHEPETHLIPLVLDAAAGEREFVNIYGTDYETPDGTCLRDYVHVLDIARAHISALPKLGPAGMRSYNIGTGTAYSVRQVCDSVEKVVGLKVPVRLAPRRPGDPGSLCADPRRIKEELGWIPRDSSLEGIISSAWQWKQRHRARPAAMST